MPSENKSDSPEVVTPATVIDLGTSPSSIPQAYEVEQYDPTETRENFRGAIALALITLMAITVLISLALVWIHPDRSKDLHDLLALIFGPLIALVGTATGYYFGSQAASHS